MEKYKMIEIEKKYLVDDEKIKEITQDAKFLGQKELIDIYYDTDDFKLTTKDWWLRNRNGQYELKMVVLTHGQKGSVDRYQEIEDQIEICSFLGINDRIPFEESLANEKIKPFAKIIAERKKYKKGEFNLDFDITDFNYSVCEVELMVEDETKIDQAVEKIEKFRKQNGFSDKKIKGKLIEYIYRNLPKHYENLVASGVISD